MRQVDGFDVIVEVCDKIKDQLGVIELKLDCAIVAVHETKIDELLKAVNNTKLKNNTVRVSLI